MDYTQSLDYVNSFINFERIPKYDYASSFNLDRMREFLKDLSGPHLGLKAIHIAGSKGKGSTCAIVASVLLEAGYRVGLYTSPHLLDARERIRVLDKRTEDRRQKSEEFEGVIKRDEFIELIEKISPSAEKFRHTKVLGKLSFFEVFTACAFLYFKQKSVDIVVLETGLGGRLDATNVITPLIAGIANISLEHTDKLGSTLESIAEEKAGIIKARGWVVSASQEKGAIDVIREACRKNEAFLYEIGKDINYSIVHSNEFKEIFNLKGPDYSYDDLETNLLGAHQVENASLGIAIIKLMDKNAFKIDEGAIRSGLKNVFWPGRIEVLQRCPYVILDGAHNESSMKMVLSSIKSLFNYKKLICVFGISIDKDIKGVSRILDEASDVTILTRAKNERAAHPLHLKENFFRSSAEVAGDIEQALKLGVRVADKSDLILVTGSLYLVGEAMRYTHILNACSRRGLGRSADTGLWPV